MIDDLYWKIMQKKDEILNASRGYSLRKGDYLEAKLKEVWISYCPEPESREVLAVDGGMWVKEIRAGALYAIDAVAIKGRGLDWDVKDSDSDVGFVSPGKDAKELVSILMEISELKLAFRNSKDADLVLMDGGLAKKLKKSERVSTHSIDLDPYKPTRPEGKDDEERLENALREQRTYIFHMLSSHKDKVVWISKRSRGNNVFGTDYPDEVVLEALTEDCGYTKPRPLKVKLPVTFSYSYVRLERGERVLRLEFFGGEERLREILSALRPTQIKGYPIQLLQAHAKARFSKADRKRLESLLRPLFGGPEWWPSQLKL